MSELDTETAKALVSKAEIENAVVNALTAIKLTLDSIPVPKADEIYDYIERLFEVPKSDLFALGILNWYYMKELESYGHPAYLFVENFPIHLRKIPAVDACWKKFMVDWKHHLHESLTHV